MNKDFLKATALFVFGLTTIFYLIWTVLSSIPNAHLNPLSAALGVDLPADFLGRGFDFRTALILATLSVLAIGLVILNIYFGAVVTSHFIRPRVNLVTSTRGVLSSRWNAAMPYVLIRMSNFHKADLVDVNFSVALTVEEIRSNGAQTEPFICYLPLKDFTPSRILVMTKNMPWTLAIPGDVMLSNSATTDYHFTPGLPIRKSFSHGKTVFSVRRSLEILVQGVDSQSYSDFVIHRKILIDEQDGDKYKLHLHRGTFKSLPLQIRSAAELEQYAD